jgi:transcriptional regulator with XRE-family HTH domain
LASRRRKLGMSQTSVAQNMHSTQAVVSKIENGGDINVSTLRRYAAVLGLAIHVSAGRPQATAALRRRAFAAAGRVARKGRPRGRNGAA